MKLKKSLLGMFALLFVVPIAFGLSGCFGGATKTLSTPNNLKIENGMITWSNTDTNPVLYDMQVDNEATFDVSGYGDYSLSQLDEKIVDKSKATYQVKVRAKYAGGGINTPKPSGWSQAITVERNAKPTGLTVTDKKLNWNEVSGLSYSTRINGVEEYLLNGDLSQSGFWVGRVCQLEVKVSGGDKLSSLWSDTLSYTSTFADIRNGVYGFDAEYTASRNGHATGIVGQTLTLNFTGKFTGTNASGTNTPNQRDFSRNDNNGLMLGGYYCAYTTSGGNEYFVVSDNAGKSSFYKKIV